MKKNFLFIALLLFCNLIFAQSYQLPLKELTEEFKKIHSQTDKQKNFFERLLHSTNIFFTPSDPLLKSAIISLGKELKINAGESAFLIFDSVMQNYIQHYQWDEYPGEPEKNKPLFSYYISKICPCITEKIKNSPNGLLDEKATSECIASLAVDTGYINTVRRIAGTMSINEMYEISQLTGLYSMEHCPELSSYFLEIIKNQSVYPYNYELSRQFSHADFTILNYYKEKNYKDLVSLFPEYKKFEQKIKLALSFFANQKSSIHLKEKNDPTGAIIYTNTYFKYINKKPVIVAQTIIVVNELLPDAVITSFNYFSSDKIANKAALYKEIMNNEIEPPMELPPGVKIVTPLPKKN